MTTPDNEDRCFEIGIALAGGCTRGAYTAGVMDFLLQALNEWEAARNSSHRGHHHDLPPWTVRLDTVAGTSAGGITAAIAVSTICTPHTPLSNACIHPAFVRPPSFHNNLYDLWVERATLQNLFDPSDIDLSDAAMCRTQQQEQHHHVQLQHSHIRVRSLLNSSFLDVQSRAALQAPRTDGPLPRWADGLALFLTTSNLRGVPYTVDNFRANQTSTDNNDPSSAQCAQHRMTRHRDWVGFITSASASASASAAHSCSQSDLPGLQPLSLAASRDPDMDNAWANVRAAAMATAALPLVFPCQRIAQPRALYDRKHAAERPDWPADMGAIYEYDAVDGGVFHNEPLSLVRDAMEYSTRSANTAAGANGRRREVLSHDPALARGAMILLHPSPRRDSFARDGPVKPPGLLTTLRATLAALLDDANFQEDELAQDVNDERDFSKFLIAPARPRPRGRGNGDGNGDDTGGADMEIGTETLGGFGGILAHEIRHHDFMLGRRNCQQFLRDKFALPLEKARRNAIFGSDAERFAVRRQSGDGGYGGHSCGGEWIVPIVPLCGSARERCELPKWPRFDAVRRETIQQDVCVNVEVRVQQLLQCFAHNMGFYKPDTFSFGMNSAWNFVVEQLVGVATGRVMAKVENEVVEALKQFS